LFPSQETSCVDLTYQRGASFTLVLSCCYRKCICDASFV